MNASCTHRFNRKSGTHVASKNCVAMTARSTGVVRIAPTITRRERSRISARRAIASASSVSGRARARAVSSTRYPTRSIGRRASRRPRPAMGRSRRRLARRRSWPRRGRRRGAGRAAIRCSSRTWGMRPRRPEARTPRESCRPDLPGRTHADGSCQLRDVWVVARGVEAVLRRLRDDCCLGRRRPPARRRGCRGACSSRRRTRTPPPALGMSSTVVRPNAASDLLTPKSGKTTREEQSLFS